MGSVCSIKDEPIDSVACKEQATLYGQGRAAHACIQVVRVIQVMTAILTDSCGSESDSAKAILVVTPSRLEYKHAYNYGLLLHTQSGLCLN